MGTITYNGLFVGEVKYYLTAAQRFAREMNRRADGTEDLLVNAMISSVAEGVVGVLGLRFIGRILSPAVRAFKITSKIERQMKTRGWTREMIQEAIDSGSKVPATNKANGHAATRHIHPRTGQSVVVDDITGEVIHVGGPGFKYGPNAGDLP